MVELVGSGSSRPNRSTLPGRPSSSCSSFRNINSSSITPNSSIGP